MPLNLSIKNAPDEVVVRIRERAKRNHRSLQGELLAIIEQAAAESFKITPTQVYENIRALGIHTPAEAVDMIRADRDGR